MSKLIKTLNYTSLDYYIWDPGYIGMWRGFRRLVMRIISTSSFDTFILLVVIGNTFIMGSIGFLEQNETLDSFNIVFTVTFIIEMALKLIALGVQGYMRDKVNIGDFIIVVFSILDLVFQGDSQFKSLQTLRTLRVLRVTKLLRSLPFM